MIEITHEMTLRVTIIEKDVESGALPFGASSVDDLQHILAGELCADDLRIQDLKSFERDA